MMQRLVGSDKRAFNEFKKHDMRKYLSLAVSGRHAFRKKYKNMYKVIGTN